MAMGYPLRPSPGLERNGVARVAFLVVNRIMVHPENMRAVPFESDELRTV